MAEFTSHQPGTFCWPELATTDQKSAVAFYRALFGWDVNEQPTGATETYSMFQLRGKPVAAGYTMRANERQRGVPPHWGSYITVASAEDAVNHVSLSVFRFDDDALVTPHLARLVGHDSPLLHLRRQGEAGIRRVLGVLSLAKKHGTAAVEDACAAALEIGVPEYRFVRRYLERRPQLTLRQVDPLIRELTEYRDFINLKLKELPE